MPARAGVPIFLIGHPTWATISLSTKLDVALTPPSARRQHS
jgi:hypothetical protein